MLFVDRFIESNKNRVIGLDIVRAVAIFLVVYGHGIYLLPEKIQKYYYIPIPLIDGVSIFFVLSGFLIGGILLKIIQEGNFSAKDLLNFWIRRWFRTLPNYFIVLSGLLVYQFYFYRDWESFNYKYIFFLQNVVSAHPPMFPEAWSLCVEEWFYLLFPIVCFIFYKLLKNKSNSVLLSAVLFILPPLFFRVIYYYNGISMENWDGSIRKVVVFRLDSLMYGIIGAYFFRFQKEVWKKYKNVCLVFSLIIILYLTIYWRMKPSLAFLAIYQYNLESLATLLSLPYFSELKSIKLKLITFIITFISIISYSMYLLNYSLVQCRLIPLSLSIVGLNGNTSKYLFILTYSMYWVYIICGSFILYKYFEKPMMDLRTKISL
jgi:peptidoglycan/LPS O-acetylase OafA/YrhL